MMMDGCRIRFYQRIMFPLRNGQGRTIGFSGRYLVEEHDTKDQPKYLNSPETDLFNKRTSLIQLRQST